MICEYCGKEHNGEYGGGRFCCVECARGFSTKAKREEINRKVSIALIRMTKMKHIKSTNKSFNSGENHPFYGKRHSENTKEKIKNSLRARAAKRISSSKFEDLNQYQQKLRLLEENNHKCMQCGQGEMWNDKVLDLEFHHKDGNHKNRIKENCEVDCPNCHSQTKNYKFRGRKHVTK